MKKLLSLALCLVLVISLAACGGSGTSSAVSTDSSTASTTDSGAATEESTAGENTPSNASVVLKVGTTTAPDGHYVKGLEEFQRLLNEYSGGDIALEIYPNSQLGNERDLVEGVSLGTVSMALVSTGPLPNFVPDFAVLDLPYLFGSADAAYKVLDSEIGSDLLGQLGQKGIQGLGFWENGFRHVTNNTKEIVVPDDLKGMKIRTMENDIHMDTYAQYGANPTPMAWSEIFTALQQGTVDGQENPLAIIETAKVYEVQKYLSLTGNFYSPCVLMINKSLFDGLTQEQQDIIVKAAGEAKAWQRQYSQGYNEAALQILKDAGCIITEVDQEVWQAASMGTYTNFESKLNQDYISQIQAMQE